MTDKTIFNNMIFLLLLMLVSCSDKEKTIEYDFNSVNDRVWVGEDFWAVPLEDWRVNNGRIEFIGTGQQATCSFLPYLLDGAEKTFKVSFDAGLINRGHNDGSIGIIIGSEASEEKNIKAAIYFGEGINIGINTSGYVFIDQKIKQLPEDFSFDEFRIEAEGIKSENGYTVTCRVLGKSGNPVAEISTVPEGPVTGIIQIVNNFRNASSKNNGPSFWYDNFFLEGPKFSYHPENRFGPVLWTMYTLSRNTLKLSAQFPPVGDKDNKRAGLEIKEGNEWVEAATGEFDPASRSVIFRIDNWDSQMEKEYRVLYPYKDLAGNDVVFEYSGRIRRDPVDRPLKMGAMTCQYHTGFPYSPVVKNLRLKEPDILYFSGDQIYEQNGGYPIKREPEDTAILNYLGKWYMFGWAFGDLMKDVPTICTPDDHDVFQGNIWGGGGIPKPSGASNTDDLMGFTQTVKMINVVNRTQCGHLPDPFDPRPIEQGMSVWYTSLNYGRISFAIVSDRVFKSGPDLVATWEGRKDHLTQPLKDPSILDKPGLEFLGKRQELFLESWIRDWKDVDMKVLLSQTLFTNVATHHGQYDGYLLGDLDSGGWPKKGRDKAISIMRRGFVFQIAGDQHVPSLVQYGIDDFRDAGWCFVTPAIAVGYSRWFRPDELGIPVRNRPEHGFPNTGEYIDAFGNLNYVYAIGNPNKFEGIQDRYKYHREKTSGFGFVTFDQQTRNITIESWRFIADVINPGKDDQHPGWPLTINQMDNYGRKATSWLPTLKIPGKPDPVVEVIDQDSGETEYIVRINGNEFSPGVFSNGFYTVIISYPESAVSRILGDIQSLPGKNEKEVIVDFE
jgi:alkaline phosphatase D